MTAGVSKSPIYLVEWQQDLMRDILNRIIPASGGFPGAGDLDVTGYIDAAVGRSAESKRLFGEGLAQIQVASGALGAEAFATLSNAKKDAVLRQVESRCPAFFQALVRHTYEGYYTNPKIAKLLGPGVRPPQPLGHDVEHGNLGLLENVKKRGRVYREAT
ncbi:MAG: gluconate 2-dehydrogenase subunit 3 family protein [Dehalococcoidia bacterium]